MKTLLLLSLLVRASENHFETFHEANQLFDRGEYPLAVTQYKQLMAQGFDSADLHFNLANTHYRNAELGKAIFHYRRALVLSPRDPDIQFNLNYTREKVRDQVENRSSIWDRVSLLAGGVNEREAYFFLALNLLALMVMGIVNLYKKQDAIRWTRNALLGLAVLSLFAVFRHSLLIDRYGVVTSTEAKVYSGVGKDNVVLFAIHEGVEFSVADQVEDQWIRIRLLDGKQGWIRAQDIVYEGSAGT